MTFLPVTDDIAQCFREMGLSLPHDAHGDLPARCPIDGTIVTRLASLDPSAVDTLAARARKAFDLWQHVPAPRRGEFVRQLGERLRQHKAALGRLVTLEAGKILSEGLGEVQEMIDICEFAVGLSRTIGGRTMPSERPGHRLMETWHPLGPTLVISAFNFPVAVWSWNAAIALICGNPVIWKPSEKAPLTACAVQGLVDQVIATFDGAPDHLCQLAPGGRDVGAALGDHEAIRLVSATGSCAMGKVVGARAAERFKRSILELGGNNAAIVAPSADSDLALRATAFSALGTAGQRCTSLRRLFVHESLYTDFLARLKRVYDSVSIGDPRDTATLIGPLIDEAAGSAMDRALAAAQAAGARIHGGGPVSDVSAGCYRRPALVEMQQQSGPMLEETFAPILYVCAYTELDEAIGLQNAALQGLSSSIFTTDMREAEYFLSSRGSDCGIANVNIGTSGAEIGGAFGGEKETGGGRESGSDAWKAYMRRATNTVNYSSDLPLAQGVTFDV